jgi:transcriptional regulator with XRE-family HTH domain
MKNKRHAPVEFIELIKAKMEKENLGITQLARKLSVSHPTITELVTYGNQPSFDTCLALSGWLGISPVSTLRHAGLLPKNGDDSVDFEDWKYMLDQLSTEDQEDIRAILQAKIARRQKAEKATRAKSFKPSKVVK